MTSPTRPTVYPGPFFMAIGVALYSFARAAAELAERPGLTPDDIAAAANLAVALACVSAQRAAERQVDADITARAAQERARAALAAPPVPVTPPLRRIGPADGYRPMVARLAGGCNGCDRRIRPGDSIVWHASSRAAWHDGCEPSAAWRWASAPATPAPAIVAPARAPWPDPAAWEAQRQIELAAGGYARQPLAPAQAAMQARNVEAAANPTDAEAARQGYPRLAPSTEPTTIEADLTAIAAGSRLVAGQQTVARTVTPAATRLAPAVEAPSPIRLRAGEIVAGAAAEGHGVLLGWQGAGERTRAELIEALRAAGLPEGWAPASKSAHRHAGLAVTALNSSGYVARAERRGKGSRIGERTGGTTMDGWRRVPTIVSARWTVLAIRAGGEAGEAAGRNVLVVELHSDDTLVCTPVAGREDLAEQVRAAFTRCREGEVYQAGEVTEWLRGVLITRFGAVRLGGNWYVPRRAGYEGAEGLCSALAAHWGESWMLPALPIATSDQLRAGLARGLAAEVDGLIAELATARGAAREAGREDLGARAAGGYLARLKVIAERTRSYAAVLGDALVADVRARAAALVSELEGLCDGTSQRGAMIEWDWQVTDEPADGGWTPRER